MKCTHCGLNTATRHNLRFRRDQTNAATKEIELELCQGCLSEFLDDSGVEKISL